LIAVSVVCRERIFDATHGITIQRHLNDGIDHFASREELNGGREQGALELRRNALDQHDQTGVEIHFAEEPNEIEPIVCDKSELTVNDAAGQFPVRFATEAEMIDVDCLPARLMSNETQ